MYRVLRPFVYHEATTVKEASETLLKYGSKVKVLAGGVDLIPKMRSRELSPECIVSIRRITDLNYIKGDRDTGLKIGALMPLRNVELSPAVERNYIVLHEAVHQIASIQVKTMGTLVGNLCVATPASDVAVALLALGAELKISSLASERIISIEDFFIGVNQTILQPSEIVTEALLPGLPPTTGGAFMRLGRTVSDISKISVAVTLTVESNTCKDVKIAVGSVAPSVIRARKSEAILEGQKLEQKIIETAAEIAVGEVKPITDIRSTAEYREEMTKVLVKRAIEKALERVKA